MNGGEAARRPPSFSFFILFYPGERKRASRQSRRGAAPKASASAAEGSVRADAGRRGAARLPARAFASTKIEKRKRRGAAGRAPRKTQNRIPYKSRPSPSSNSF